MSQKQYVFGYGSLVSPDDVFRTLGRRVELIYPVQLNGWIRDWSVVINSTLSPRGTGMEINGAASSYIAVLNVRRPAVHERPTHPNGVLFAVTDEDLRKLDARETHYERLDVTADVVNESTGIVYTYSGLPDCLHLKPTDGQVVIPGLYQELVAGGFAALGPDMHETYLQTTHRSDLPVHSPLP